MRLDTKLAPPEAHRKRLADEALGVHGSSLLFGDGESDEDARIGFQWTCTRGQRRPDLERPYFGTYYELDERVPRLRHAPDGRLFHNAEVFTEPARVRAAPRPWWCT